MTQAAEELKSSPLMEEFGLAEGDIIEVSNVKGKPKDGSENRLSIIGKYYPADNRGIVVLPANAGSLKGEHGEVWTVKIRAICNTCIIGEWLEYVRSWKKDFKKHK